jgi:excisionase family DNA binding protein
MDLNGYKTYTAKEVASILKVTEKTILALLREGTLTGFKVGAVWRVTKDALDEFMAKQV